jgi:hypothetical protein
MTLWRVRVTIFAGAKQWVLNITCVRILALVIPYAIYIIHAPYYIAICAFSSCIVFFHIISQRQDFRDKIIEHMCVFCLLSHTNKCTNYIFLLFKIGLKH